MDAILVSTLILVVGLVFIAIFSKRYADFWFKILVSNKLALVDQILGSEEPPAKWRLNCLERVIERGSPPWLARGLRNALKRWYLYRLDRLLRSVQNSSYIKKNTKFELLSALHQIQAQWQQSQHLF